MRRLQMTQRPVHYEEVLGVRMATRAPEGREA